MDKQKMKSTVGLKMNKFVRAGIRRAIEQDTQESPKMQQKKTEISPTKVQADVHQVAEGAHSQTRKVIPKWTMDDRSSQNQMEQRAKESLNVMIWDQGMEDKLLIYEQSITDSQVSQ